MLHRAIPAEALANIARDPGQSVEAIFSLTQVYELYLPTLESIPDAWTVTVKVNDTGGDSILFGGLREYGFRCKRVCLDHQQRRAGNHLLKSGPK